MLIKEINSQVNENFVDIEIKMVLQQIIKDKKITNGAQTSVMVNLLELLATGRIGTSADFDDAPQRSAELVAKLKSMSDAEITDLASEMLSILDNKDAANRGDIKPTKQENADIASWIRRVSRGNH